MEIHLEGKDIFGRIYLEGKAFSRKKTFSFLQLQTVFFSLEFSTDEDEDEIDDDEDEGSSSEEFTDSIEDDVKLTAESPASTEVKENTPFFGGGTR